MRGVRVVGEGNALNVGAASRRRTPLHSFKEGPVVVVVVAVNDKLMMIIMGLAAAG